MDNRIGMGCPNTICSPYSCGDYIFWKLDNEVVPAFDHLRDYLKLEIWTVDQAMWLLCGLSPKAAKMNQDDYINGYGEEISRVVRIDHARPLHEKDTLNAKEILKPIQPYTPLRIGHELAIDSQLINERTKLYLSTLRKMDALQAYNRRMDHLLYLWKGGAHQEEQYPIRFWVEWAIKKDVFIPWFDWAKQKGLLPGFFDGPWMDPDNPHYSHELWMAAKLWRAAFQFSTPTGKSFRKHIDAHYKLLFKNNFVEDDDKDSKKSNRNERLVTLLNPNKKDPWRDLALKWRKRIQKIKDKGELSQFEVQLFESGKFFPWEFSFALVLWNKAYGAGVPRKLRGKNEHSDYLRGIINSTFATLADKFSSEMMERIIRSTTPRKS